MSFYDLVDESLFALTSNKVRSFLTILGIVIGIASVIAMISIGQGAKGQIEANIQSLGSNLLTVSPGFSRSSGGAVRSARGSATSLTLEDAQAIAEQVSTVAAVAPELNGRYQVVYKSQNTNTSVIGTNSSYQQIRNLQMESGSFLTEQSINSGAKVAVLGSAVRDDLFGEGVNPVGESIKINRISFKIAGVTQEKGGTGFTNFDDMIFVPISTAQRYLSGSDYVTTISAQARSANDMSLAQNGITQLLLSRHNISDPQQADFYVQNQADIVNSASQVTETFTALLAAVAGISLVVGGIGIMNMMLTTVTERTREIGLRKSIGAQKRDIRLQFLFESLILTLVGGIAGILLGFMFSFLVDRSGLVQTDVSWTSVLLSFGVSALIGIVFGYYPARRASELNPIEALRYA